jgi:threonine/homoserine/homoserine lactone efflux protein
MIPSSSSLLLFISAALLLLVIPGPAVFYIVGRSIGHGHSAGLASALGVAVGSLVHTAAVAVGLSALLMSSAVAFAAVKYLGAAYLIYLGIQKIRREDPFEPSAEIPRVKLSRIFAKA